MELIAKRKIIDRIGGNNTYDLNNSTSSSGGDVDETDVNNIVENYIDDDGRFHKFHYSITVENPSATEDFAIAFTNWAITVTEMRGVVRGTSPSITWTIRHGTDRSATGAEVVTGGTTTTSQSSGSDVTSFNDATIVADSFIWLETTAKSGTVNEINITSIGTIDEV